MHVDTLVVALHDGHWRIAYDGQWYGTYKDTMTAAVSAMRIARNIPGTWVVVRKTDGFEKTIWNPEPGQHQKPVQMP